jgi:hypothetical protein
MRTRIVAACTLAAAAAFVPATVAAADPATVGTSYGTVSDINECTGEFIDLEWTNRFVELGSGERVTYISNAHGQLTEDDGDRVIFNARGRQVTEGDAYISLRSQTLFITSGPVDNARFVALFDAETNTVTFTGECFG